MLEEAGRLGESEGLTLLSARGSELEREFGFGVVRQLLEGQVNDDAAAGIDKTLSVSGGGPTNADVVGGALTAGKPGVPWATFQQGTSGVDQVFVRSFAGGAWTTRGNGTVGGKSSASPTFSGSLNFDQAQDGEVPAIDFAGAGRTVPWSTWYENTPGTGFGANNVFASRFDNTGGANQNKWIFGGQSRGTGGGSVPIASLNIHTDQAAENPSVAGGSAADPTKPGPWVTWQEIGANAPGAGKDQIFVEKPIGPAAPDCNGVKPAAVNPAAAPIGGFCWQQVGVERLGADPSLNVDRTRDGIEPDIAFTGANDAVPWVVWYETGASGAGLNNNDMVFAAKGVAPGAPPPSGTVDGGFNWITVGNGGQGVLDNSAGGGPCGASSTAEGACSLNKTLTANAENPRVVVMTGLLLAGVAGSLTAQGVQSEEKIAFKMERSSAAKKAGCLPAARGDVEVESVGPVENMAVRVRGLPPNTAFDFFVIQVPNNPFGLAWYQGDIETNEHGEGTGRFVGRFNIETFIVAPGSAGAPAVHHDPPFPDASSNPATAPVHTFHLGLWFNSPEDAAAAGCPSTVTPFSGDHTAGIQALSTRNYPDDHGPLRQLTP